MYYLVESLYIHALDMMAFHFSDNMSFVKFDVMHVCFYKDLIERLVKLKIAEDGFNPLTSGLWAQHASATPLRSCSTVGTMYGKILTSFQTVKSQRKGRFGAAMEKDYLRGLVLVFRWPPNKSHSCGSDIRMVSSSALM